MEPATDGSRQEAVSDSINVIHSSQKINPLTTTLSVQSERVHLVRQVPTASLALLLPFLRVASCLSPPSC